MARPLAGLLLLALLLAASVLANPLAGTAARYNRDASVAATAIYASLRSMSALLSVLKDADVEGSVVVTSVTVSPGQMLEPLTRTLERFADIMFVVALVSATLAVVLGPASGLGAVLAAAALAVIAVTARRPRGAAPAWLQRLVRLSLTLGLMFALVLPAAYSLAFWWGDGLAGDAAARAAQVLEGAAPDEVTTPEVGRGVVQQVQALMAMAADLFEATVDLTVAYLLKLIVLPLVLTLAGWAALRTLPGLVEPRAPRA